MADIKSKAQDINPNANPRNINDFVNKTGNVYESLAIISKRANVLNNLLREELHSKLQEFANVSDSIEEIEENMEQVEISKFYERLPNPALIATHEYINGELHYRYAEKKSEDED